MKVTTLTEYLNFKTYRDIQDNYLEVYKNENFDVIENILNSREGVIVGPAMLSEDLKQKTKQELIDGYLNVIFLAEEEKKELINQIDNFYNSDSFSVSDIEKLEKLDIRIKVKLASIFLKELESMNDTSDDYFKIKQIVALIIYYPLEFENKIKCCKSKKNSLEGDDMIK